jgi:hypothetical protein
MKIQRSITSRVFIQSFFCFSAFQIWSSFEWMDGWMDGGAECACVRVHTEVYGH